MRRHGRKQWQELPPNDLAQAKELKTIGIEVVPSTYDRGTCAWLAGLMASELQAKTVEAVFSNLKEQFVGKGAQAGILL